MSVLPKGQQMPTWLPNDNQDTTTAGKSSILMFDLPTTKSTGVIKNGI